MLISELCTLLKRNKSVMIDEAEYVWGEDHITVVEPGRKADYSIKNNLLELSELIYKIKASCWFHEVPFSSGVMDALNHFYTNYASDSVANMPNGVDCLHSLHTDMCLWNKFRIKKLRTTFSTWFDEKNEILYAFRDEVEADHFTLTLSAILKYAFSEQYEILQEAFPALPRSLVGDSSDMRTTGDLSVDLCSNTKFLKFVAGLHFCMLGYNDVDVIKHKCEYGLKNVSGDTCVVSVDAGYIILHKKHSRVLLSYGLVYNDCIKDLVPPDSKRNTKPPHMFTDYVQRNKIENLDVELLRLFKLAGNDTAMSQLYDVLRDIHIRFE